MELRQKPVRLVVNRSDAERFPRDQRGIRRRSREIEQAFGGRTTKRQRVAILEENILFLLHLSATVLRGPHSLATDSQRIMMMQ